jgi:hypothetical protein
MTKIQPSRRGRIHLKCEDIFEHLSPSVIGNNTSQSIRLLIPSFYHSSLYSTLYLEVIRSLSIGPFAIVPKP